MPASQPEGTEQRVRIDPASKGPAPLRVSVVSALGGHPYSGDIWLAAREFTQLGGLYDHVHQLHTRAHPQLAKGVAQVTS